MLAIYVSSFLKCTIVSFFKKHDFVGCGMVIVILIRRYNTVMLSGSLQVSSTAYLIGKGDRQLCFDLSAFSILSCLQAVSNYILIFSAGLLLPSFVTLQIQSVSFKIIFRMRIHGLWLHLTVPLSKKDML